MVYREVTVDILVAEAHQGASRTSGRPQRRKIADD